MRTCKESSFYTKENFTDMILITILSVLLYSILEFNGGNFLATLFSGINRSLILNVRIVAISTYIVSLFKMWIQMVRKPNLWTSLFVKVIVLVIFVFLLETIYITLIGFQSLILDILVLIVSQIISQIVEWLIEKKFRTTPKIEDVFKYLNIFLFIGFII